MADIEMPTRPGIASVDWKLTQPSQMNRSEFTGARRVTILAQAPRWSASVKIVTIIGETAMQPWRAFLASCRGRVKTFRIPASDGVQKSALGTVVVFGAGQTGYTLNTAGWVPNTYLRAGSFVTVGDQLLQLTARALADADGKATLTFEAYLRTAPANSAAVEVREPYAVVSMSNDTGGWSVSPGQIYSVQFECEEAF